jgi:hypothetical protein
VGGLIRHMGHVREMREVGVLGGWVVAVCESMCEFMPPSQAILSLPLRWLWSLLLKLQSQLAPTRLPHWSHISHQIMPKNPRKVWVKPARQWLAKTCTPDRPLPPPPPP